MTICSRDFNFHIPTKIIFGLGKAQTFVNECDLKASDKILFVIDPGLLKLGISDEIVSSFSKRGFDYIIFDALEPNPTAETVEEGAKIARNERVATVIAIGGGSAIDTAKGITVRATNEGYIMDYSREGNRTVTVSPLPLIAIPSTAGTGSEVTSVSVLTDTKQQRKLVVASPSICPKIAVLDPQITQSLPAKLTAETGLDALTHAIEAYITLNDEPITDALAMGAIKIIAKYLCLAVANGNNLEARSQMLLASTMAGMAFGNAGLGIVHSTAHSLGGKLNISHGLANAIMLPYCMEFNLISKPEKFRDIAMAFGESVSGLPLLDAAYKAVEVVRKLSKAVGIEDSISKLGVTKEILRDLTVNAMNDKGTFPRNPRQATFDQMLGIFEKAYKAL
jgi:alcohol dehydrogenase